MTRNAFVLHRSECVLLVGVCAQWRGVDEDNTSFVVRGGGGGCNLGDLLR